jgi:hypothetical protein
MSAIACLRGAARVLDETGVTIEYGDVGPDELITQPNSTVEQFEKNLERLREENAPYRPEHNYSHYQAQKNYARAKDVGRYFWRNYDEFTTIHIVRTADENDAPLVEQTEAMTPDAYYQSRYRLLKRLSDDYARLTVLAPKYPTRPKSTVRTHIHTGLWLPGHYSPDCVDSLRDKHHEKVPGATSVSISAEHHSSDDGPPVVQGMDQSRGGTSRLPHELAGANQPLMGVETDALDLHDPRSLKWCATLSAGSDGSQSTRGMSYWRERGNFSEYADEIEDSMRRQTYRDLKRSELPYRIQRIETNVMPDFDVSERNSLRIIKTTERA